MASTQGKLEVDVEVKSNPDKFWSSIRESDKVFPKAFPELYKSIDILEGDGKAVGSIRLVNFAEGNLLKVLEPGDSFLWPCSPYGYELPPSFPPQTLPIVFYEREILGFPFVTKSKEKVEAVDEENKTLSYSVLEGEVLNFYKSFKAHLTIKPKEEGSLVKWSCEFEKSTENAPDPEAVFKDFAVKTFHDLDAFLLKA